MIINGVRYDPIAVNACPRLKRSTHQMVCGKTADDIIIYTIYIHTLKFIQILGREIFI